MKQKKHSFYLQVVVPSILGIVLFVISVFWLIIPVFEQNMMERKKEMIKELTNTTLSLIEEYYEEVHDSNYNTKEAQQLAVERIEKLRYGAEKKDYFWIIDQQPEMIMHPYRKDLIKADLSNYKDPDGTMLFMEAVKTVEAKGEGYINYRWQWKDDSTNIVPKLSYVNSFEPWGWIIGTGIYLDDVNREMRFLKNRIIRISLGIILIIGIVVFWIMRQSLRIENQRKEAEEKLRISRLKYKTLVEASTEGTIMIVGDNIIYSNIKFNDLLGCSAENIYELKFADIFTIDFQTIVDTINDPNRSASFETQIKCKDKVIKDILISVSRVMLSGKPGFIIVTKELSRQKQVEKESGVLAEELQTSLLMMNLPVSGFVRKFYKVNLDSSVKEAIQLMNRKDSGILLISRDDQKIIGVITDEDLRRRVIQPGFNIEQPVSDVMTAPVKSITDQSLLFEALLKFNEEQVDYLCMTDISGNIIGLLSRTDVLEMQVNSTGFFIREIEKTENTAEVKRIYNRVPAMVHAFIESGMKTSNITRIITAASDAILSRIIELSIEEMGAKPPCAFAYLVIGSEGRMEQTLFTDQDNAIVFENVPKNKLQLIQDYFLQLGEKVSERLHEVGFNYCKGGIMARNEKWCQPMEKWKDYFSGWIRNGDPQSLLESSIFFDFRVAFGEKKIEKDLKNHVNEASDNKSAFFYHLAQNIINTKLPSASSVEMDTKKVMFPLIGFARLYALKDKVESTNTLKRLEELSNKGIISKTLFNEIYQAYSFIMALRFRHQAKNIMGNDLPDNLVEVSQLTDIEKNTLKKVISKVGELQSKTGIDFKSSGI